MHWEITKNENESKLSEIDRLSLSSIDMDIKL